MCYSFLEVVDMKKLLEKVDMINTILGLLSCPVSKSIYEHIIANDMFIYEKYVYLPIILGIWAVVVHFIVRLVDIVVNALMRHVTVERENVIMSQYFC